MYNLRQLHILYADIIRIEQRTDENKTRYIAGRILWYYVKFSDNLNFSFIRAEKFSSAFH